MFLVFAFWCRSWPLYPCFLYFNSLRSSQQLDYSWKLARWHTSSPSFTSLLRSEVCVFCFCFLPPPAWRWAAYSHCWKAVPCLPILSILAHPCTTLLPVFEFLSALWLSCVNSVQAQLVSRSGSFTAVVSNLLRATLIKWKVESKRTEWVCFPPLKGQHVGQQKRSTWEREMQQPVVWMPL